MFKPRSQGVTLRRAEEAVRDPHPGHERFDDEFLVTFRCPDCGVMGHGPRKQLQDALREHKETCSARRVKADQPTLMQLLYPKQ